MIPRQEKLISDLLIDSRTRLELDDGKSDGIPGDSKERKQCDECPVNLIVIEQLQAVRSGDALSVCAE